MLETTPVAPDPEPGAPTPAEPIADGVVRQLDPASIQVDRMTIWILVAVLTAMLAVQAIVNLFGGPLRAGLGVALLVVGSGLLVWWAIKWPDVSYRHASYKVDELGIEIRRGVVWRRVINVPRSRVQHTDVRQGPLERQYDLGTLVIYTAGTEHAEVTQSGLHHDRALRIRDHLLPKSADDAV